MSVVILSSSDPGGGNSIIPLVKTLEDNGHKVISVIGGKSRDIWKHNGCDYIDGDIFSDALIKNVFQEYKPDLIVCSTSVGLTIEKKITLHAKKEHIPTLSVLDFWSNYWKRFSSPDKKDFIYLTDHVCIMDEVAKKEMIQDGFDENVLYVTGNPHFDHFADGIESTSEDSERLLFISQPLSELENHDSFIGYGYDEIEVLSDIIGILQTINYNYKLVLRPHPKETPSKFDAFIGDRICISDEIDIKCDISLSGLIIGMSSSVLLQATVAGKKILSYQPNLKGDDPLVSNRTGLTRGIYDQRNLKKAIEDYFLGKMEIPVVEWPENATKNVVHIIESQLKV